MRPSALGAERIVALSRYPGRQKLASQFGATDVVERRGEKLIQVITEFTDGVGVDPVRIGLVEQTALDAIRRIRFDLPALRV